MSHEIHHVDEFSALRGIVDREKAEFKKLLGSPGAPQHADTRSVEYVVRDGRRLRLSLSYSDRLSPIGFPYHAVYCCMQLDGKRITQKQLA